VQTDGAIPNNKPDIRGDEKETCLLIGVEISGDITVFKQEAEKNKDLAVEIQRMWNVNTKVMRIILEENGTI
jgi:hypothetical protein